MSDPGAGGRSRGPSRKLLPHARPGRVEAVDLEIGQHLDACVERLIAEGLSPEEARREAERRFGDLERIREEVHAVDRQRGARELLATLWESTVRDLRLAVRGAARKPWLAIAVIATLGVGIGVNTVLFSLVEAALLRSLPYPEPDRVVWIMEVTPSGSGFAVAPANFLDWKEDQTAFQAMSPVTTASPLVTEGGDPQRVPGARVASDYFQVIGVAPAMGRTFTNAEDDPGGPNVVVVSHEFWAGRLGADPEAIGRSVRMDGEPYTVIGVMPEGFRAFPGPYNPSRISVWRPNPFASDPPEERQAKRLTVVARLRDGVTVERADAEMKGLAAGLAEEHPATNGNWSAMVLSQHEIASETVRTPLLVLLGAVGFILLIACLNVGNLLLAQADQRRNAITLRRALGARRSHIVRQLFAESLILSLAGAVLGVLLARASLPVLLATSPVDFTRISDVQVSAPVLFFALGLALFTTLITGLAPAIGASAPDLLQELKERGFGKTESRSQRRGRSAFVVLEIALSVVLLIGAGLMLGSYARLSSFELGFRPNGLLSASLVLPRIEYAYPAGRGSRPQTENFTLWEVGPQETSFIDQVRESMSRVPGVESAAAGNFGVLPGWTWASRIWPEESPPADPNEASYVAFRAVTANWFETLGIPFVQGTSFEDADRSDGPDVVVLDEAIAASLWPGGNPIGRSVVLQDGEEDTPRPFRVVGVVSPVRQAIFDNSSQVVEEDVSAAYVPYRQQAEAYVDWQVGFRMRASFMVRTNRSLGDIGPALREAVWSVDPGLPVNLTTARESVAAPLAERRFYMNMLALFGALAICLAASGVFSVMAYSVSRKRRELGIKVAFGAPASRLRRAELFRGAYLATLGIALGVLGAVGLTRFLAAFLYGVGTVDPATYSAVAVVILTVVLAAAYVPARRASSADPMESLRVE